MLMVKHTHWTILRHNGPSFPAPYERLPRKAKLLYGRTPLTLSADAEESAVLFAKIKAANHQDVKHKTFIENFFHDFRNLLSPRDKTKVVQFSKLDFKHIIAHLKLQKKDKTKQEKADQKQVSEDRKRRYGFCTIKWARQSQTKEEPIGNFMVEPPGIFRGRPGNPKHGHIKLRIYPSDVIINCSPGFKPRTPNRGEHWKEIVHEPSASWLAKYINNLGEAKYIQFGQTSSIKIKNDGEKYRVAQSLAKELPRIRRNYMSWIKSKSETERQLGVALYFIDRFALRVGNEKGVDKADTVGCSTLRNEHILLKQRNVLAFDFKGKDSIQFKNEFSVPSDVYKACQQFVQYKRKKYPLFDKVKAVNINQALKDLMPGLTAKVFRTCNASLIFQHELDKVSDKRNLTKMDLYGIHVRANLKIAQLCNHKKTINQVALNNAVQKRQSMIKREQLKLKKLQEEIRTKTDREKKRKLQDRLATTEETLKKRKIDLDLKTSGKEFSLSTSLQNYIDPRISAAWCKRNNLPVDMVWTKALQKKYEWTTTVNKNFTFHK